MGTDLQEQTRLARLFVSTARFRYGQANLKNRPAPRRALHFNRSGVDLGNPAADGEPQPDTTRFARARFIGAIESLKHIWQIRLGDANPRVAHLRDGIAIV